MSTALAEKKRVRHKPTRFCYNSDTFEVMERTSDKDWREKFDAWCEAMRAVHGGYFRPCFTSPTPWGHIMFEGRYGEPYVCCDTPPQPIWSDGRRCLYKGQKVGWCVRERGDHYGQWNYGRVVSVDTVDGVEMLTVDTAGVYYYDRQETLTVPLSVLG